MPDREKPIELISKWDVVNKLIRLENQYQFFKGQWDADVLYRRICELEIGIGKTPPVAYNLSPTEPQQWIPVTERLPEYGRYLCNVKSMAFRGASYQAILKYENGGFIEDGIYTDFVTHWMPLPQPPKGE